jgi:hypothetical protein
MHAYALRDSRRRSQRENVHFEVYLIAPGSDRAIKARVTDISSEGIGIESSEEIVAGTELRLFSLTLSITTRVIWAQRSSRWGKKMYRAGLTAKKSGTDLTRYYAHLLNR